jgi:23S rRNA (adenine2503-C2)-methyltransferase
MKIEMSCDGTIKIIFDGYYAVLIPTKDDKVALCVSCQKGCPIGCKICFSGRFFERNLASDEIVSQFEEACKILGRVPNTIVFMGMGEPSLNFSEVKKAADYFHNFLSYNHITISTSCIDREKLILFEELPYALAISLHSPFDSVRKKLVNSFMSVREIAEFSRRCAKGRNKRSILIQYSLIKGVNDRDRDLKKLVSYKWPKNAMFNLIEFNSIGEFEKSDEGRFKFFKEGIIAAGWKCFTRKSRGADIGAACGMLTQ